MPWLVNIVHREDPVHRPAPAAVQSRKDSLLGLWREHIGPVAEGGEGDYEDFWEQAVRLHAAIEAFGPGNIWLTVSQHEYGEARNLGTGERRPLGELAHLPRYGAQASQRHQSVDQPQALLADNYYEYEAFRARAGRRLAVCGFAPTEEGATDLGDVLAGFAADGIRKAFLKANLNKYAAFPVDLPEGFTRDDAGATMYDALDFGAMYLEGASRNLLAQEFVTMEYEYRVFVVGHCAVTAAGCIEEFTPLDNNGYRFDNKLRRNRAEASEVGVEPAIAGILTGFARNTIDALALEVPELTDYVIDVALGADGEPLVIELNPLLNSGLYASQPFRVTSAMAAQENAVLR
ncbi:ATP-grasp domain-containing protein [Arthrobacter sp. UYCo732]|uniref:ATP-grasp domain-containing protein n=1 Tax=Arthrobacter sp. UYCo732 TaxID=3156336 RepID=UPI00339846D9